MNNDQIALFDRAGFLAHHFKEMRRRMLSELAPDTAWFFHPVGYWIDYGFSASAPEYDLPTQHLDVRTANFARRIGDLARGTKIWGDKEAMVRLWVTDLGLCEGAFASEFGVRVEEIDRGGYEKCRYSHET
jgi:hypothetical protein